MNQPEVGAAAIFKALSDTVRLRILGHLGEGELRVTDLHERIGGSQANISEHMARLRAAGLVVARPAGRQTFYRVSDRRVTLLLDDGCRFAQPTAHPDGAEPPRRRNSMRVIDALRAGGDRFDESAVECAFAGRFDEIQPSVTRAPIRESQWPRGAVVAIHRFVPDLIFHAAH